MLAIRQRVFERVTSRFPERDSRAVSKNDKVALGPVGSKLGYLIEIHDGRAMCSHEPRRIEALFNALHGLSNQVRLAVERMQLDIVVRRTDPHDVDDSHVDYAAHRSNGYPVDPPVTGDLGSKRTGRATKGRTREAQRGNQLCQLGSHGAEPALVRLAAGACHCRPEPLVAERLYHQVECVCVECANREGIMRRDEDNDGERGQANSSGRTLRLSIRGSWWTAFVA